MERLGYSPRDVWRALGVARDQIHTALQNGDLVSHVIGKRTVIWRDDLERWVKSQRPRYKHRERGDEMKPPRISGD